MLFFITFSIIFARSVNGVSIRNRTFVIHPEFSDVLYGDGLLGNYTTDTLTKCGAYCGTQNCLSFSYSNDTGICRIHSTSLPSCEPKLANQNSATSLPFYREQDYQQQFCPCSLDLEDGSWTVIHQRFDGSVDFERDWANYKGGFGNSPNGEFWLGLENIYLLTKDGSQALMVELFDKDDIRKCSYFNTFYISSEVDKYRLTVDDYVGTAGDSMSFHNGMQFSTTDQDNDLRGYGSCVAAFNGPGWLNDCLSNNLNGLYGVVSGANAMCWRGFRNFAGLKKAKMLIKGKLL
ncbi:ficolin-2-like [Pecten maximus]|uniref:ficolin-2-like n=1 Tax=Pecten maximus TaxID=6579 RepID=UPI0014580AFC|nr:ficolin-2-like [Pecten maximus]